MSSPPFHPVKISSGKAGLFYFYSFESIIPNPFSFVKCFQTISPPIMVISTWIFLIISGDYAVDPQTTSQYQPVSGRKRPLNLFFTRSIGCMDGVHFQSLLGSMASSIRTVCPDRLFVYDSINTNKRLFGATGESELLHFQSGIQKRFKRV